MNEKQARITVKMYPNGSKSHEQDRDDYFTALGYLEAIDKAEDVVEVLKLFENIPCSCRLIPGRAGEVKRCDGCFTRKTLAKWEEG